MGEALFTPAFLLPPPVEAGRRPSVGSMATRKEIAPRVEFDPERTDQAVRPAFNSLARDPAFIQATTLRDQVLRADAFLKSEEWSGLHVTLVQISRFLGLFSDSVVGDIIRRGDNGHDYKGRASKLTDEHYQLVQGWIETSLIARSPLTLNDVVERLRTQKQIIVTTNALQKGLKKRGIAKTIKARPEEASRLEMNHASVAAYLNTTPGILNNVNAAFVFNMDECGVNDFADAKDKHVLVPSTPPTECSGTPSRATIATRRLWPALQRTGRASSRSSSSRRSPSARRSS